jgi:Predicted transcriptional regulator
MLANSPTDMHPADVRAAIYKKGLTLAAISRAAKLPEHACRAALQGRSRKGEDAIAKALGLKPEHIWPSRFSTPRRTPNRSRRSSPSRLCQ